VLLQRYATEKNMELMALKPAEPFTFIIYDDRKDKSAFPDLVQGQDAAPAARPAPAAKYVSEFEEVQQQMTAPPPDSAKTLGEALLKIHKAETMKQMEKRVKEQLGKMHLFDVVSGPLIVPGCALPPYVLTVLQ
jgi:hypothetical protein